ncbi:MAG: benzoate-CoA ligase family protein [Burkholderiales bacterium]
MAELSSADRSTSPPQVRIPRDYNAAHDLLERNLIGGRGDKIAVIDDAGSYTYNELSHRANRFANALQSLAISREQRIILAMHDGVDFVAAFLGAIKAGIVPIPINTLLPTKDYDFMLRDSRASALVLSEALFATFEPAFRGKPELRHVIVSGRDAKGHLLFANLCAQAAPEFQTVQTSCDEICFWLYSSGSTGRPKGTVHLHSHLIQTAELYARAVLGIKSSDVVFSAAKLFFAYGLGNGLTFPFSVGATTVLMAERPSPQAVARILKQHQPTVFYAVPTLFGAMLASADLPSKSEVSLRVCTSAGEALPADIGKRWTEKFGVEILDGIGSTEMLHIFLSNRPGDVRYGTTGRAVPGYTLRLVDDEGHEVERGELGELQISGPSAAIMYWNNRERSRQTFMGPWTRSGDKYMQDADGYYVYSGRTDDMLKVSGQYVSPFEVESALLTHPAVLEAAVIGTTDEQGLIKPKAYVVIKPGVAQGNGLAEELKLHVKSSLTPHKYPRWFEFVDELPKTATGKIQRFKLRALDQSKQ